MYRCSQLDTLIACGQSQHVEVRIGRRYEATDAGTATHEVIAAWAGRCSDLSGEIDRQAYAYGVDGGEVGKMFWRFYAAMQALPEVMRTDPQSEVAMESGVLPLTGHIDWLVENGGETAYLTDAKTGRIDYGHGEQMRGYAHLVFQNHPHVWTVYTTAIYCRSGQVVTEVHQRAQQEAYVARMRRAFSEDEYRIGKHCGFCGRRHDCPAMARIVGGDPAAAIGDGTLIERYDRAKALASVADDVIEATRAVAQDGDIPTPRGTVVGYRTMERATVDAPKAWAIMEPIVGPRELVEACKLTKGSLSAMIASHCQGKSEKTAVWDSLKDAGAVTMTETQRFGEHEPQTETGKDNDDE
jgi:hypothetical protein